jgi:flotillin
VPRPADAEAYKKRTIAKADRDTRIPLARNQEAVFAQPIAEQLPEIVGEASKAFGNIGQLTVLNGAEGVGQMFSQVLGMGAAAIPLLRGVLDQTTHANGSNGAAPASKEQQAKA